MTAIQTVGTATPNEVADIDTFCEIVVDDARWDEIGGLPELIEAIAAAAMTACDKSPSTNSIAVALTNDAQIRVLNSSFRGRDKSTNVLSFPAAPAILPSGIGGAHFLGDIALAYETIADEVEQDNKTMLSHTAHLVAHGVLHLCGLDHDNDADATLMEDRERAILARFSIPDPYAPIES